MLIRLIQSAGIPIEFTRGYGIVRVVVKGNPFLFVNTHLEMRSDEASSPFRWIQSMQMMELVGILGSLPGNDPIILVGDFNSPPEDELGFANVPDVGENLTYVPPYRWVTEPENYEYIWNIYSSSLPFFSK